MVLRTIYLPRLILLSIAFEDFKLTFVAFWELFKTIGRGETKNMCKMQSFHFRIKFANSEIQHIAIYNVNFKVYCSTSKLYL